MAISVTCECGKQFKVRDELAGKRGKCAACGQVLSIPTLASSAALEKATPAPLRACPACWEALQPNAVICLHCGHDLRTGKQVPQAMSTAPAAPARPSANVPSSSGLFEFEDAVPSAPSAKVPTSSARLWIALIVVGTCLAGVAAAVALLTWGREAGNSAIAPPRSPKADGPVAKKEGPDSKVTPDSTIDQPALKKLLAKVTNISPADVAQYEKFLSDPSYLNAILYQGSLPYTGDDVRDAINLGLEKLAIAALIRLIQEKKNSTDKADLLICAQSIKALGQFRSHAKEATPLLAELQNYKDNAVGSAAKLALEDIQDEIEGAELQTKDPVSYKDRQRLQGTWKPVSFVATGIPLRKPENNATMTFTGGRVRIDVESLHISGRYHLNAANRAKEIDLTAKGKENLFGVYSLEGNTLNICLGKTRPKGLSIQNEDFAIQLILEKQAK